MQSQGSRRNFLASAAGLALTTTGLARGADSTLNVGVVGCGGRGTGAIDNLLRDDPDVRIVALADLHADRIDACLNSSAKNYPRQIDPTTIRKYTGLQAYRELLDTGGVDLVLLAAPSGFRPLHLEASIQAGKHVFAEKSVAVDAVGVRKVLELDQLASMKKLSVVVGYNRRYDPTYIEWKRRIFDGEIGDIRFGSAWWLTGRTFVRKRQAGWSDLEFQANNWPHYRWLSGDVVCDLLSHNLDVINWVIGAHPLSVTGNTSRKAGIDDPCFGNAMERYDLEYRYPSGITINAHCRRTLGRDPEPGEAKNRVEEELVGTKGEGIGGSKFTRNGQTVWNATRGAKTGYVAEMEELKRRIRTGSGGSDLKWAAETALTCIMGRMAALSGKEVTWEEAMSSPEDLFPKDLSRSGGVVADRNEEMKNQNGEPKRTATANSSFRAFIVGVGAYEHPRLKALSYSVNDARALDSVLRKQNYQATLLTDDAEPRLKPRRENVVRELEAMLKSCRKGDTVLIALAGHGLQFAGENDSYFCPSDAKPFAEEKGSLLSLEYMYSLLDRSFATTKLLVVDACRDDPTPGRNSRGVDGDGAPKLRSGMAALFSCSSGERAYEFDDYRHGIFFYHLLQGLEGKAADSDGEVTFDSLSTYVRKQVPRDVSKRFPGSGAQTPNDKRDISGASPVLVKKGP